MAKEYEILHLHVPARTNRRGFLQGLAAGYLCPRRGNISKLMIL